MSPARPHRPRVRPHHRRRPAPLPADPAGPGPSAPETAAPIPSPPLKRRVRMLVEVIDSPGEVALVTSLCEERGWSVSAAEPGEAPPRTGRTSLAVEVRFSGARWRAVRSAVAEVERLMTQAELGAWVRDAALVEHALPARVVYHVHRTSDVRRNPDGREPWYEAVRTAWWRLGGAEPHRVILQPADTPVERVEAELAGRVLGGRVFTPGEHGLRAAHRLDERRSPDRTEREHRAQRRRRGVAAAVGMVGALFCGMATHWAPGAWKAVPAALGLAAAVALGRMPSDTRQPGTRQPETRQPDTRPSDRRQQMLAGAMLVVAPAFLGHLIARAQDAAGPAEMLGMLALGGFALFVGAGVVLALRRSMVTRHAAWLVPLAVPVLWAMFVWLGRMMHTAYLEGFGIPGSSVAISSFWTYTAAALPMGIALGFVAFFTALAGWLRHLHLAKGENRVFAITGVCVLSVVYAITALAIGVERAGTAGRTPADYHGLQGNLMCVRPVPEEGRIPVENGPLPTNHPLLSFGASGDWIWLWDPERAERAKEPGTWNALAVRREDVQLRPPREEGACPKG